MRRAAVSVIGIRRSRGLFVLLALMHTLAGISVAVLPWAVGVRLLLLLLVGVSAGCSARAFSVTGLVFSADRTRLSVRTMEGKRRDVSVMPGSVFFPRLIILKLKFKDDDTIRFLTLFPDQVRAEEFRQLNLWLRWRFLSSPPSEEV